MLFSADMVRALLDGRKTQTRRTLKKQPLDILPMDGERAGREWIILEQREPEPQGKVIRCRYGVPGDLLWVRETGWMAASKTAFTPDVGNEPPPSGFTSPDGTPYKRCPSIHMPRWASRLTLRITNIRVERLQAISEEDAIAEGCPGVRGPNPDFPDEWDPTPQEQFRSLWEATYGPESWAANPWCWRISFTCIRKNVDEVLRHG